MNATTDNGGWANRPGGSNRSASELEREGEEIRADLDRTLDEIERKLSPGELLDRSVDFLRDHGSDFLAEAGETVRRNPVPVLLTAAGLALALADVSPRTRIYCVEPAGYDDTTRSLPSGQLELAQQGATSLCDALMAPTPGTLTFAINRRLLSGGWVVTDAQVMDAMAFAWRELKLVVEPGGAVALAAVLGGVFPSRGKTVGIVLSGGNVDVDVHARALNANAIVRRS